MTVMVIRDIPVLVVTRQFERGERKNSGVTVTKICSHSQRPDVRVCLITNVISWSLFYSNSWEKPQHSAFQAQFRTARLKHDFDLLALLFLSRCLSPHINTDAHKHTRTHRATPLGPNFFSRTVANSLVVSVIWPHGVEHTSSRKQRCSWRYFTY